MLGIVTCVDVRALPRLHGSFIVVNNSLDDSISDSLGDNLFGLFNTIEAEFLLDIDHWDLRITDVKLLQTKLQNSVLKSHDQGIVLILLENFLVLGENFLEGIHVSGFHTVYDLEIWGKWLLQEGLREDLSVWNFSHQQLNDNLEFLNLNSKSFGSNLWSSSQSLDKSCLGFGVFELNSLNSSEVVQISRILVIWNVLWEICLDNELTSLLIKVLGKIGSQNHVGDSGLTNQILSKACSLVRLKHESSYLRKLAHLFVSNSNEVHGLCSKMIKSS